MNEREIMTAGNQANQHPEKQTLGVEFRQHDIWRQLHMSQADIGAYQEAIIKSQIDSPNLASSYAQAIALTLHASRQAGLLQIDQPCYLLELEASDGYFACLLLTQLEAMLTPEEWRSFNLRYLLTDSRAERISDCWQHPSLRSWIERGHLEPVEYDAREQRYINLKSRRLVLGSNSIMNPLIVIANGVFSSMRQSLYHVHYGKCYTSLLSETDDKHCVEAEGSDTTTFEYQWQETDSPRSVHPLLPRYIERLDSNLVLIPHQTLNVLDNLQEVAGNGCLVLTSDRGFYSERRLREQGLPEMGPYARCFLPVNGHALTWHIESQGGQIINFQSANDCALHSIQWLPSGQSLKELNIDQLEAILDCRRHTVVRRMSELSQQSRETVTIDQLLSLLELSNYDHRILFAHMDCLFESLETLDSDQRVVWRDGLEAVWKQYYFFIEDADILIDVGLLAMRLGAWGTAKRILSHIAEQLPNNIECRYYLAATLLHLGHRNKAEQTIKQCSVIDPDNEKVADLKTHIEHCIAQCQNDPCYNEHMGWGDELSLHPLAAHYTEEFLYQYRDPSIAAMTSLPEFKDINEFEEWRLKQEEKNNKSVYAVVHREYGFVGTVSLHWHKQTAFFYFWIGTDYQGQGYGQRAANLLFSMAHQSFGLDEFFTCAFSDNARSLQALKSLKFESVSLEADATDDDYLFFIKSLGSYSYLASPDMLRAFLKEIKSPIKLKLKTVDNVCQN